VENLAGYLRAKQEVGEHVDFDDFVHTFSTRRSIFPFKAAFQASSIPELLQLLDNYTGTPSNPRGQPRIGFVFNGQGAQWYAMGRELLHSYPMFHSAIVRAEQSLKTCGAPWSLIGKP
jgi:acyl transferase domain-containing protein